MPHAYLPSWSLAVHTRTRCLFWSPPAVSSRWSRFSRGCYPPGLLVFASRSPWSPRRGLALLWWEHRRRLSLSLARNFNWTAPSRLGPRCWFLGIYFEFPLKNSRKVFCSVVLRKEVEKSPRDDFVKRLMLKEYAAEVAARQEREEEEREPWRKVSLYKQVSKKAPRTQLPLRFQNKIRKTGNGSFQLHLNARWGLRILQTLLLCFIKWFTFIPSPFLVNKKNNKIFKL